MLSAFQLENNRLTRLEAEESQPLIDAVWVDLVEPDDDERLRVQSELGQSLATRPELEDIEASARFFEDEDGLHIHSFFFFEDAEDQGKQGQMDQCKNDKHPGKSNAVYQ